VTQTTAATSAASPPECLQRGTTLLEVLVVMAGMLVVSALAVPAVGARTDELATGGAARYLATLLQRERSNAIRRATHMAFWFQATPGAGIRYAVFADGNGNGVRASDISRGIDIQVTAWEFLSDHFAGVAISIAPGVSDIDSGSPIGGAPVRLGGSELLSFSPTGTATSGTVYLSGRTRQQYAVRVLGSTGRVRLLRFNATANQWSAP